MGDNVELNMHSRQQQSSKSVKKKAISPPVHRGLRLKDKRQVVNTVVQPHIERYFESRESACDEPLVQVKESGNNQEKCCESDTKNDDELVKHMSNLPGYLQQLKRGDNYQEKVLNLGVLELNRLERMKNNEKLIPAGHTKASSSCSNSSLVHDQSPTLTTPSTTRSKMLSSQSKKPPAQDWHFNSIHDERRSVQSQRKVTKPVGVEIAPWSSVEVEQNLHMKNKSSVRRYSEMKLDKGKRKESDRMTTPRKETSSFGWSKHVLPISSDNTYSAQDGDTNMAVEEEFSFTCQSCEHESIVLLLPKGSPKNSCSQSDRFSKCKRSLYGDSALAKEKTFSGNFSPKEELPSVDLHSETPNSCPLPLNSELHIRNDTEQCNLVNYRGGELQEMHQRPNEVPHTASNIISLDSSSLKTDHSIRIVTPGRLDQNILERPAEKGRQPSPSRRFSFSNLGKMRRSISSKESLTVMPLSSSCPTVKSGEVRAESSASVEGGSINSCNRARSSPLRRLLDPLLKPKGVHLFETARFSKEYLTSVSFKPVKTTELLQNQKNGISGIQALLQVTLNNGLPLFKLVVDNNNDILAAAVKQLPTPGEDTSSLIYALYSVHEIKKKGSGSWISGGYTGKGSSFGYNIIGQMKVSSSYPPHLTGQIIKDQYVVRESVLYDVDIGQAGKETHEFKPSKALAAIIIKNPDHKNNDGVPSYNSNHLSQDGFTKCYPDDTYDERVNENLKSTTVILGGIHGLPDKGVSSPSTNLWGYGGSCDCGGWDVDCKLQILTNQNQISKTQPPISCSSTERLDLFEVVLHDNLLLLPIFLISVFT